MKFTQFPLHPDTPEEGRSLEQLFAGRNIDLEAAKARMRSLMLEEGLAYGERTMTYNSRLAQELAKWAEGRAGGEDIHDALYRAYFVEGVNIAGIDALVLIAERAGLASAEARAVLESRRYGAEVDADWRRSRELGITGVPTFVAGNHAVVGAQPYPALERLVIAAGASPE